MAVPWCRGVRLLSFLVVLMLIPSAVAGLEVHEGPGRIDASTFTAIVTDGDQGLKTHQDMAFRIEADGRTWFQTGTIHEHDGLATFTIGLDRAYVVLVDADGTTSSATGEGHWSWGNDDQWPTEVKGDGLTLSQPVGTMAEWIVRGDQGVWLRGWLSIDTADRSPFDALALGGDVEVEYRVHGQTYTAMYRSAPASPENKSPVDEAWPACTDRQVRMDPQEVRVGVPIRVTVGDLAQRNQPSTEYRLLRDVPTMLGEDQIAGTALQEETIMAWRSDGPAGSTSFRLPAASVFRLQVEDQAEDIRCELLLDASGDAGRPIEVEDDQESFFGLVDGDLVFSTDVPNGGHYEHPTSVAYQDGDISFLIWSGKLHSHGGPVAFTIPDPLPGNYTVRWDTAPQGPDPIVPDVRELTYTVSADAAAQEAPAPLGALALLAVALIARRR